MVFWWDNKDVTLNKEMLWQLKRVATRNAPAIAYAMARSVFVPSNAAAKPVSANANASALVSLLACLKNLNKKGSAMAGCGGKKKSKKKSK